MHKHIFWHWRNIVILLSAEECKSVDPSRCHRANNKNNINVNYVVMFSQSNTCIWNKGTAKINAAICYLSLKACSMELMTKHSVGAVCRNPATARCWLAACEVLSTAVSGLLHATFWWKCISRNISQKISQTLPHRGQPPCCGGGA